MQASKHAICMVLEPYPSGGCQILRSEENIFMGIDSAAPAEANTTAGGGGQRRIDCTPSNPTSPPTSLPPPAENLLFVDLPTLCAPSIKVHR
ncbi:hypothetical protein E2C01_024692 [Portunus trituberculatus]|uniref:Uncharacterized protein n=1 Tax=Portunus trituberculatus TaxID=210409 RepID=A0A5B7EFQ2_PORTR|nr:hypothetical protein [Portunus trituberculatus]